MKNRVPSSIGALSAWLIAALALAAAPEAAGAIPAAERTALTSLYNSTTGASWTNNAGWKTPPLDVDGFAMPGTECGWFGITCDAGGNNVQSLIFNADNNVNGTLPAQLGNLSALQHLFIGANGGSGNLSGALPAELGNLTNLVELNLNHEKLTGGIPASLGNLVNLQSLDLSYNLLSGPIPVEFGNLAALQYLFLAVNQLTGPLPAQINGLTGLTFLNVSANQLSGPIPDLSALTGLWLLSLDVNQFSGGIPAWLGGMTSLIALELGYNQLTGTIPASLGNLTNLTWLELEHNHLTGSIPSSLGSLTALNQQFLLSGNLLSGPTPASLTNLTSIGPFCSLSWNSLYSNDAALTGFLNVHCGGWADTQTLPPTGLAAGSPTTTSVTLTWTPIAYTGDTGGYRAYYSTTSGGPYTTGPITADKSAANIVVPGLSPSTPYYFVVRAITDPHTHNENTVTSTASAEVGAATLIPAALSIQKSVDHPTGTVGVPVDFILLVTNTGQAAAANVQISDTLPAGLSPAGAAAASSGTCSQLAQAVNCTVATLAGGASVTVTIPVVATAPGTYQNVATAVLQGGLPVQSGQAAFRAVPEGIPALSSWGMLTLAATILTLGSSLLRRA